MGPFFFLFIVVLCVCCAVSRSPSSLATSAQTYFTNLLQTDSSVEGVHKALIIILNCMQCAKKDVSDRPGLVDFAIRLENSVLKMGK